MADAAKKFDIKQSTELSKKMLKYKKTLPGQPYVKLSPLTEGFVPGVGYLRNLFAVRPVWAIGFVYIFLGGSALAYQYAKERKNHPDMALMYRESYKVRRKEDVDDPTRECYN